VLLKLDNVCAERMCLGDCSKRPDQQHKMPGCRVVALFWVRPNHHDQRNGEQKI